jgi:hypothetical protein
MLRSGHSLGLVGIPAARIRSEVSFLYKDIHIFFLIVPITGMF